MHLFDSFSGELADEEVKPWSGSRVLGEAWNGGATRWLRVEQNRE
jgi:hypothetical protein